MSRATWTCVRWMLLVLLSSCLADPIRHRAGEVPDVTIAQGVVKGSQATSLKGRDFFSYRGIRYAKAPVGELRFKAPEPVDPGSDVIYATNNAPMCTQRTLFVENASVIGQEDCLFVNVYTPKIGDERLPVMVFIHGGAFSVGSGASDSYGPEFLLDKDIVLVTLNYRLGALGFLSTGDSASPGNYGLKDQVAALQWVQDNIAAFGGDPERVTIFGQSAGSICVHLQMVSDLSKGLFHRAISESGTAISVSAWPPLNPYLTAKKQAEYFNCPTEDSQQLVDCLRQVDSYSLVDSFKIFYFWSIEPSVVFGPVKEDPFRDTSFLTGHPLDMLRAGKFQRVPWIVGVVAQEGILQAETIISNKTLLNDLNTNWNTLGPKVYEVQESVEDPLMQLSLWQNMTSFYFNNGLPVTEENGIHLVDMSSDRSFVHSTYKSALFQAYQGHDTIYMYNFNYRGMYSSASIFFQGSTLNYGVCHSDELIYLFKQSYPNWPENHPDLKVLDSLINLWTTFATYGTPTPPSTTPSDHVTCDLTSEDRCDVTQLQWSPVPPGRTTYLNIYSTNNDTLHFSMDQDFYKDRMAFWDQQTIRENI